jgi:hypothetical protein
MGKMSVLTAIDSSTTVTAPVLAPSSAEAGNVMLNMTRPKSNPTLLISVLTQFKTAKTGSPSIHAYIALASCEDAAKVDPRLFGTSLQVVVSVGLVNQLSTLRHAMSIEFHHPFFLLLSLAS